MGYTTLQHFLAGEFLECGDDGGVDSNCIPHHRGVSQSAAPLEDLHANSSCDQISVTFHNDGGSRSARTTLAIGRHHGGRSFYETKTPVLTNLSNRLVSGNPMDSSLVS